MTSCRILTILVFISSVLSSCRTEEKITVIEKYASGNPKIMSVEYPDEGLVCMVHYSDDGIVDSNECELVDGDIVTKTYQDYFKSGTVRLERVTHNGLIVSQTSKYPNGNTLEELIFKNGRLDGLQKNFRENGKLRALNYYHQDSLLYKKVIQESGEVVESLRPWISKTWDKSRVDHLTFYIPNEIRQVDWEYYIEYDFVSADDIAQPLPNPKNRLRLSDSLSIVEIDTPVTRNRWVYGFVTKEGKDNTIKYDSFLSEMK